MIDSGLKVAFCLFLDTYVFGTYHRFFFSSVAVFDFSRSFIMSTNERSALRRLINARVLGEEVSSSGGGVGDDKTQDLLRYTSESQFCRPYLKYCMPSSKHPLKNYYNHRCRFRCDEGETSRPSQPLLIPDGVSVCSRVF